MMTNDRKRGSTWKMCRCDHYQTQHLLEEHLDQRTYCLIKGCKCQQYRENYISRQQRKAKRREKRLARYRKRKARERAQREKQAS